MELFVLNFRYLAAVGFSLAVHTILLWSVPEKKAFAMPTGSQSSQVNIQLVAPSAPAISSVKKTEPHKEEIKTEALEKKMETVKPKKPITKKIEHTKKPSKIKPSNPKPPVKKQPKPAVEQAKSKATPKESITKTKQDIAKTDSTAKPVASKSGATEKPQLIQKPSFLKRPSAPPYPRIAQRKGVEGTALYEIWLNEKGKQIKQELITSSGASVLDEAALNAIRDWKFSPQIINGQAIAHRVQIPVRFSLN